MLRSMHFAPRQGGKSVFPPLLPRDFGSRTSQPPYRTQLKVGHVTRRNRDQDS